MSEWVPGRAGLMSRTQSLTRCTVLNDTDSALWRHAIYTSYLRDVAECRASWSSIGAECRRSALMYRQLQLMERWVASDIKRLCAADFSISSSSSGHWSIMRMFDWRYTAELTGRRCVPCNFSIAVSVLTWLGHPAAIVSSANAQERRSQERSSLLVIR